MTQERNTGVSIVTIEGKRYAVVPVEHWQALRGAVLPALPPADERGFRPAAAAARAVIARTLIQRRVTLGLTQKALARRAGVRVETLSRLESGKHRPQRETLLRLESALRRLERKRRPRAA